MRSNRLSYRPATGVRRRSRPGAKCTHGHGTPSNLLPLRLPLLGEGDLDPAHHVRDQVVQERDEQVDQRSDQHQEHADVEGPGEQEPAVDLVHRGRVLRQEQVGHELLDAVDDPEGPEHLVEQGEGEQHHEHDAEVEEQRELEDRPWAHLPDHHPGAPGLEPAVARADRGDLHRSCHACRTSARPLVYPPRGPLASTRPSEPLAAEPIVADAGSPARRATRRVPVPRPPRTVVGARQAGCREPPSAPSGPSMTRAWNGTRTAKPISVAHQSAPLGSSWTSNVPVPRPAPAAARTPVTTAPGSRVRRRNATRRATAEPPTISATPRTCSSTGAVPAQSPKQGTKRSKLIRTSPGSWSPVSIPAPPITVSFPWPSVTERHGSLPRPPETRSTAFVPPP